MDEGEWICRIQNGETEYLTPLIEKYYSDIQKYCYWRIGNKEESKDLTQETFYRFCRNINKYTNMGKLRGYLFTIARHLCNDYLRKSRPLSWLEFEDDAESLLVQQNLSVEDLVEREQLVNEFLKLLPEEQSELIFMRYCLDLTFREISRITGIHVCIVQYRIKRGLIVLRKHWEWGETVEKKVVASRSPYSKELPLVTRG